MRGPSCTVRAPRNQDYPQSRRGCRRYCRPEVVDKHPRELQAFEDRRRHRLITQWSGNALISCFLNQVFGTAGIPYLTIRPLINGFLQILGLAWVVSAAAVVEGIEQRILFISSCFGMLPSFTLQTVCSVRYAIAESVSAAHAGIFFIFFVLFCLHHCILAVSCGLHS